MKAIADAWLRRGSGIGRFLRRSVAIVATTGLLGACATAPTGPTVMVLPGNGKTFEQFHTDDLTCRQFAAREIAGSSNGESQRRYDIAYMQCMYANGHQIPVPGGRPSYTSTQRAYDARWTNERSSTRMTPDWAARRAAFACSGSAARASR